MKPNKAISSTTFDKLEKVIFGLFILAFAVAVSRQINFSAADLGRHILNGKLLFSDSSLLFKNYYSFTHPDYAFINHHWLSGWIFWVVFSLLGFDGLHLFFVLLMTLMVTLAAYHLSKETSRVFVLVSGFLLLPLLCYRNEIRPETFSYLFIVLFWKFVPAYIKSNSYRYLAVLLLLQMAWVNMHIFFFFGPFISVVFSLSELLTTKNIDYLKRSFIATALLSLSCLVNTIEGALSPLNIFKEYGYMVSENQSLYFMINRYGLSVYWHVILLLSILLLALGFIAYTKNQLHVMPAILFLIPAVIIGIGAIRGFTILALAAWFILPVTLQFVAEKLHFKRRIGFQNSLLAACIFFFLFGFLSSNNSFAYRQPFTGIGLLKGSNGAGDFFNKANIVGNVFNNYDVGSYFIFHHYPKHKPFTDNRPEAYPVDFFQNEYSPALKDDTVWQQVMRTYAIRCIYFYRHDNTEFGQPFLIRRLQEPMWIPVYVDDFNIILVKNEPENQDVLEKYAIDKSIFSAVANNQ